MAQNNPEGESVHFVCFCLFIAWLVGFFLRVEKIFTIFWA
jgi:hypothetical protein